VFERLRAAVNAALDAATPPPDWRDLRNALHRAAVEGRATLLQLRDALAKSERELASERRQLEDARRRGTLAVEVGDAETVAVAERFTARHGERVTMLEQKLSAQQAELALTQRDVDEVVQRLRDLELRGAGNILGADQSGFAHAVGFDAYLRLMERTVERIRGAGAETEYPDPDVSMGGAAYLPEGYVSDPGQKLHLYRRLSRIRRHADVDDLRRELEDRFGEPPPEVERLLDQVTLRILGRQLGVERILLRDRSARVNFRPQVVPRLALLEPPLRDRQVHLEVRRMTPLSLELIRVGPEPLAPTLIRALAVLEEKARAA